MKRSREDLPQKAIQSTVKLSTPSQDPPQSTTSKSKKPKKGTAETTSDITNTITTLVRVVDGTTCALRSCAQIIDANASAALIATNEKLFRKFSEKELKELACLWVPGRISFHRACWENVYQQYTKAVKNSKAVGGGSGEKAKMSKKELNLIGSGGEVVEFFDGREEMTEKVAKVVELVRGARHMTAFTGAGISTSAGISDYRGTSGVDTKQYLGQKDEDEEDIQYEKLIPTTTHAVLTKLVNEGRLQYIITQNCDNLHMKSGTPKNRLSELHGNVFVEYCEKCFTEYTQDYCVDLWSTDCYQEKWYVKCPSCKHNHYTSRKCSEKNCKGKLRDTIVNFGDMLHDRVCGGLPKAEDESKKSDLMLCLGSSLTVSPADSLCLHPTQIIICNLQETPMDKKAVVRLYGSCDTFMALLQQKLADDPV